LQNDFINTFCEIKVYLAENDVSLVEVGHRAQCYEELRPVAVRDFKVGH